MEPLPHITVAAVVYQDGRFLMVKEKSDGLIVYNQPAGHLEIGETLIAAAERETLEETGWKVKVSHFLGIYHYTSTLNAICYVRHCFIADPVNPVANAKLDPEIQEAVWLSADEIKALSGELRSPIVWRVISDYLQDVRYPLSFISSDIPYG